MMKTVRLLMFGVLLVTFNLVVMSFYVFSHHLSLKEPKLPSSSTLKARENEKILQNRHLQQSQRHSSDMERAGVGEGKFIKDRETHFDDRSKKLPVRHVYVETHKGKAEVDRLQHSNIKVNSVEKQASPGCGRISTVGEPQTVHKTNHNFGSWLKEIHPNNSSRDSIFIFPKFQENRVCERYKDVRTLGHNRLLAKYVLPFDWAGTGQLIHNNSIIYNKYETNIILKYNLENEVVQGQLVLQDALIANHGPYQWYGYTDIDLAEDETGVYAIYTTMKSNENIVISQIDTHQMQIIKTWNTSIKKKWCANSFMSCGRLYTLKRFNDKYTILNKMFDIKTNQLSHIKVDFTNQYEGNSMLSYNPKDKKLYAWDNGYLVQYDVKFS